MRRSGVGVHVIFVLIIEMRLKAWIGSAAGSSFTRSRLGSVVTPGDVQVDTLALNCSRIVACLLRPISSKIIGRLSFTCLSPRSRV